MRDAGYSEDRDVVIEWREAKGDYDRVPALIADLIRNKVELIVVDSTVATQLAMRATTIPIVMAPVVDPVALSHGLRACWSIPILSTSHGVLGTFAVYHRVSRARSEEERDTIDLMSRILTLVIDHQRAKISGSF